MAANDLYILPEEVQLLPVKDLPEQTLSKFEYDDDDFVITYTHARNTSKVIDASSASLLKEFRKPKSLPEGVFTYATLNKLDAEKTLEIAYKFLVRLRSEGFLIFYDEKSLQKTNETLKPGDRFKEYEIVSKLQGVADTEVFKIKKNNSFYALKLLKTKGKPSHLLDNFYNEIEILKQLDGLINPGLTEHGEYESDHYLIMDWVDGSDSAQAAEKYNNVGDEENLSALINLCCNILNAYCHLHRQDIIHSDIHPKNIIVTESGEIRIIDFGLSRVISNEKHPSRGGMNFFYEPEFAESIINSTSPPTSSHLGEQYALAALMYQLITGKQYLDFSFDSKTMFTQIARDSPIPFSAFDIAIEPAIEKTLLKALSKNPAERYNSIDKFYEALSEIKTSLSVAGRKDKKISYHSYCDSLKEKYGYNGNLIENGLQVSPKCSANFGAAGIAYMLYRMAMIEEDAEMLSLADVWVDRAKSYIHNNEEGFYAKEIEITAATVGKTSIYHTASGVHLVQALISKETGDYNSYLNAIRNFIYNASQPCENLDLTLGKSASLIGCSLLYENMLTYDKSVQKELLSFGRDITADIWSIINTYASIREKNPVNYRGIAHGWAGILYATLKWCNISGQPLPANFFERIHQLASLAIEEDDLMRWNISNTEKVSWTGWCHGSSGYTFLWTALFRFTNDEKYLQMAEKTVRHFLKADQAGINGSLCCGKSGECYALLNTYKATQNEFYLGEARRIGKIMLPHVYSGQMRNHSLYKGNIGAGILFSELDHPQFARMPLFE